MRARQPVRIVTLSRDYGSGGGEIAHRVGRALGWRVIDRALIEAVAQRIHAPREALEPLDEHVGSVVERIAGVFARGAPETPVLGAFPDPDTVAALERAVLKDALEELPFVLVGHGGQCVFSDRADALHVRIVAPLGQRIRAVAARRGLELQDAVRETERHDAERRRYMKHHFGCDANDPGLYHLQLSTGFLTVEQATAVVLQVVGWRETAPEPGEAPLTPTS